MKSTKENKRSPIPRGSPSSSSSHTKSPSQLSTTYLIRNSSSSPSPGRKRQHPNYLQLDEGVPPNKKINTPTKEEKEIIMKEKEMLYKRLAEEKHTSFYLTPQPIYPILPMNNKYTSIYSYFQHQHAAAVVAAAGGSPPQMASSFNPSLSPSSVGLSHAKLGPCLTGTPAAAVSATNLNSKSPGSSNLFMGNTAGISGLPTPGGSSVGTPPRPSYPTQIFPAPFLKFPFSPPTPSSSIGLLSPWNMSNRSLSVSSSTATPGSEEPSSHGAGDGTGMLQCLAGAGSNEDNGNVLATSTPRSDNENLATSSSKKQLEGCIDLAPPHQNFTLSNNAYNLTMPNNLSRVPHPSGHPKPSHPCPSGFPSTLASSVRSPHTPFSPAMHIYSPYAGSVSSCPSVSSSSGCSSASENLDNPPLGGGSSAMGGKNYVHVLSEYHVGPHCFIANEKDNDNQSEEATNSGRNTPVDVTIDDSGVVSGVPLPGDIAQELISRDVASKPSTLPSHHHTTSHHNLPATSGKRRHSKSSRAKGNSPCPFSVESMSSGSPISQGYIVGSHITDRPSSGVSSMSSSLSSRDSTPESEDLKHDPHQPHQGSDVFCLVPGRLSLLSSTQKYRVTVDEVRRRLSHPECLNASVLGGILRRAKSKNGGTMLRQRLQDIGVSLPPGRRKQTELSLLTSLVESESLHLAGDFNRVCESFFPHGELAQIIARQHTGTPEAQHRISMVKATQLIVSELQAMLDAVGGPSNIRPNDLNNPYPGLTNFSLLTHGFGNPAIATSLGVLQTYLQELLAYYDGRKPIQTPENKYVLDDNASTSSAAGMRSGLGAESASSPVHGNMPHQHQHHPLQNPLLYATRHFPSQLGSQEAVSSSHIREQSVEVSLKEEPVDSPGNYVN